MSLSVRGIARRYTGITGNFGLRQFAGNQPSSLRTRLEMIARRTFSLDVDECIYGWTARYEQTWSSIRVRVRLRPDAGITAQTMQTLRATWRQGVRNTWNDKWAVGRPGEAACPLEFDIVWVTTGEHHTVQVRPMFASLVGTWLAQSNMTLWNTQDTGAVAAHEYGHMLGHPDEYPDSGCPNRSPVNSGTVMDRNLPIVESRLMTQFAKNIGSNVVEL
jgi:hypothetical protein